MTTALKRRPLLLPGDKLPNGAIVLQLRGDLVLALNTGNWQPWVTWRLDDDHNAYWGHYFGCLEKAIADFNARSAA